MSKEQTFAPFQQEKAAQINLASAEAQELRETGMRPVVAGENEMIQEKASFEKAGEDEGKKDSENPPAAAQAEGSKGDEKASNEQVGGGEEVAGLTQLAAERAGHAAAQAKEAAVGAAANAATATKETVRKYGAATVTDAERMYGVGKERVAGLVQGSQDAVKGAAQSVSAKTGPVLKSFGEKLVAAGAPPPSPSPEEKND